MMLLGIQLADIPGILDIYLVCILFLEQIHIVKAKHDLRLALPGQQCDEFCNSLGKFRTSCLY